MNIPRGFKPPIVRKEADGVSAFRRYDWYFHRMSSALIGMAKVFLIPCAATKPIYSSSLHRKVFQRFALAFGEDRELLVVSEPVVLIAYEDLYIMESAFLYDFPPKKLDQYSRQLFVSRLRELLSKKDIVGCLPRHHASLINDAVGENWKNYWRGDMYNMFRKASTLKVI
ncbi:hypothetical protein HYT01_01490 [Candidatus Giovannonibacteria bacterium]|nr:hypothetical protein [Candidatus Giovannonibacteria bacterium]